MLKYKTPMARKAAQSYCRRCLAVMVCCVLVFGLTVRTAPRAEATAAVAALTGAGSALSSNPIGASIAFTGMVAVSGGSFVSGYIPGDNKLFYGTRGYEMGEACWDYLYGLGGDIYDWCVSTKAAFTDKGGVAPGDTITLPANVAEAIRQWTVTNMDFSEGVVSYTDYGTYNGTGAFVTTDVDLDSLAELDAWNDKGGSNKSYYLPIKNYGSLYMAPFPSDFSSAYSNSYYIDSAQTIQFYTSYTVADGYVGCAYKSGTYFNKGSITSSFHALVYLSVSNNTDGDVAVLQEKVTDGALQSKQVLVYSPLSGRLYCGFISKTNSDQVQVYSQYYYNMADEPVSYATTLVPGEMISTTITNDVDITVPADLPVTITGAGRVPIFTDLTAEDVLNPGADVPATDTPAVGGITAGEITSAVEAALPVTGAVAGDQVVAEVAEDPDSLGAVFISKFPFSIPWDVAKAIGLLASPPSTPRWELDFLAPIADRVGGWNGDTTVVLDFSEYPIVGTVTRWLSTILFVYALALGTKRLIWTA